MVQKPVSNNVKRGTGQREVRPVWNNAMRVNHQNFSNSRRNFVPISVLTKSGIVPVSAARPINTTAPKSFVNAAKTRPNAFQKVTSIVGEQGINAVKSSACWVWRPKIKADSSLELKVSEQVLAMVHVVCRASVDRLSANMITSRFTPSNRSSQGERTLVEGSELQLAVLVFLVLLRKGNYSTDERNSLSQLNEEDNGQRSAREIERIDLEKALGITKNTLADRDEYWILLTGGIVANTFKRAVRNSQDTQTSRRKPSQ
ncbi:hypothetical protein Tco_0455466 [Tanacetum coccineum]